jgi:RNA-directed DNA polymerase
VMRSMMERLRLTVNEQKTRLYRLPRETFDFLSYTFGRQWSRQTGGSYLGMRPSQKALRRLRERLHEETIRKWLWKSPEEMAQGINRLLVGWSNYFRVGTIARAWGSVDHYVFQRLRQWWCRKYRIRNRRDARFSAEYLYQQMGVVCLRDLRSTSRERRRNSGPRAGCGKTARPVR